MHYDPLLSSRGKKVVNWGHCWVVVSIVVGNLPWAPGKFWSLPILFRLYHNRQGKTKGKKTSPKLVKQTPKGGQGLTTKGLKPAVEKAPAPPHRTKQASGGCQPPDCRRGEGSRPAAPHETRVGRGIDHAAGRLAARPRIPPHGRQRLRWRQRGEVFAGEHAPHQPGSRQGRAVCRGTSPWTKPEGGTPAQAGGPSAEDPGLGQRLPSALAVTGLPTIWIACSTAREDLPGLVLHHCGTETADHRVEPGLGRVDKK